MNTKKLGIDQEILPHSIGIVTPVYRDGRPLTDNQGKPVYEYQRLVEKGTPIPFPQPISSGDKIFLTTSKEEQDRIDVTLIYGESFEDCKEKIDISFKLPRLVPRGKRYDFWFDVDSNGIITVSVKGEDAKKVWEGEIIRIEGQIARMQGELNQLQESAPERQHKLAELQEKRDLLQEQMVHLDSKISQIKPQLENANREVQTKDSELKNLHIQLAERQKVKEKTDAEITKLRSQINDLCSQQGMLDREVELLQQQREQEKTDLQERNREAEERREQINRNAEAINNQLKQKNAEIEQAIQTLEAGQKHAQELLDNLQGTAKRLGNRSPNAPKGILQEAEELSQLLDEKGPNNLKERLNRVLKDLQSLSKDFAGEILSERKQGGMKREA